METVVGVAELKARMSRELGNTLSLDPELREVVETEGFTVLPDKGSFPGPTETRQDQGPCDEELLRSLAEAIRRVEGRQVEAERRQERLAPLRAVGAQEPA